MFSKYALKVSPHTVQFLCSSPSLFPLPLRETDQANRCTRFTHPPFAGSFVLSCFAPARRFFCFLFFLFCFARVFRRPFLGVFFRALWFFWRFWARCVLGRFFFCLSRPFEGFFSRVFDSLFFLSSPLLLLFPFVCFLRPHTHARKPTPFWETTGSGFSPGPRGSVPPGQPLRPRGLETPWTGKLYTLVFRIIMPQGHLLRASARLRHGRWTIAAFAFFFPFPPARFPLPSLLRLG